jgi:hypothetical protein
MLNNTVYGVSIFSTLPCQSLCPVPKPLLFGQNAAPLALVLMYVSGVSVNALLARSTAIDV